MWKVDDELLGLFRPRWFQAVVRQVASVDCGATDQGMTRRGPCGPCA